MAQTRVNKTRSAGTVRTSASGKGNRNRNPQQVSFELKQRVIVVLNKLADRDTYQMAAEELGRIAESLTPEGLGPFLSCIFETDSQHKSIVRRECVKVFGTLAACHGELLAHYLPKMVGNIIRRLKDPDSNVRDACVDVIGVLASKIMHPLGNSGVENGGTFSVLVKPLFEALAEQNRQLQVGSALCLGSVIDNAGNPPLPSLQKMLPRIMKLLTSQSFSANAALLSVIGSIVQAGGASSHQALASLVPCMLDALQSNDWATRKAAAEAFGRMALSLGPSLSSFKSSCVAALESCRFDKVKPVRDTVAHTLQAWKSIPDAEVFSPVAEKRSTPKENWSKEAVSQDPKSSHSAGCKSTFLRKSGSAVTKSAIDGISISTAKKRTPLIDTKINLRVPHKLDSRKTDNWHIEVAVPRTSSSISVMHNEKLNNIQSSEVPGQTDRASNKDNGYRFEDTETFGEIKTSRLSDESRASCETKCILVDNAYEGKPTTNGTPNSKPPAVRTSSHNKTSEQRNKDNQPSDCLITDTNTRNSTIFADEPISRNSEDLAFIRKQLSHIENRQSSLMELLQVFMQSSLDSISTLETKVHGLERIVDEMAQELAKSAGKMEDGNKCCRSLGSEMLKSRFWKRNDRIYASARLGSSDSLQSIRKTGREASYKSEFGSTESWENCKHGFLDSSFKVKPLVDAWEMSYGGHGVTSPDSVRKPMPGNVEIDHSMPRAFGRNTWKEKNGKDSVRGSWQDSMDEASLSGKYFTAEDTQINISEVRNSRPNLSGRTSFSSSYENGYFWTVWTRAVEHLSAEDLDSAFVEVLRCEDDLLLIQLMKRTGPVLGKLSQETTLEILPTVIAFLLDQKFLDTIIPWFQQVVDLISTKGPNYLGLSLGERMETLSALQEASCIRFTDLSTWSSVTQLASKLANVWEMDLRSISKLE